MYYNGEGVLKDYVEVVRWWRKVADQGDADGQTNLGYMYDNGKGVRKNYVEAYKWYNLAEAQGNEMAKNSKEIIAKKMTAKQIREAWKRSADFKPRSESTP